MGFQPEKYQSEDDCLKHNTNYNRLIIFKTKLHLVVNKTKQIYTSINNRSNLYSDYREKILKHLERIKKCEKLRKEIIKIENIIN